LSGGTYTNLEDQLLADDPEIVERKRDKEGRKTGPPKASGSKTKTGKNCDKGDQKVEPKKEKRKERAGDEVKTVSVRVSGKGKDNRDDVMDVDSMLGEDAGVEETTDGDTGYDMTVDPTTDEDVTMGHVASSHLGEDEGKRTFLDYFYCPFIFVQFLLRMMWA